MSSVALSISPAKWSSKSIDAPTNTTAIAFSGETQFPVKQIVVLSTLDGPISLHFGDPLIPSLALLQGSTQDASVVINLAACNLCIPQNTTIYASSPFATTTGTVYLNLIG